LDFGEIQTPRNASHFDGFVLTPDQSDETPNNLKSEEKPEK